MKDFPRSSPRGIEEELFAILYVGFEPRTFHDIGPRLTTMPPFRIGGIVVKRWPYVVKGHGFETPEESGTFRALERGARGALEPR